MREITSHKVNGLNDSISIKVLDEPGQGGANHVYELSLTHGGNGEQPAPGPVLMIKFQNGPIKEAGYNGFSGEALLAVVEDRLKSFQEGPYKCRENACALTHLQEAMMWLHRRTHERMQRGVEGTHKV